MAIRDLFAHPVLADLAVDLQSRGAMPSLPRITRAERRRGVCRFRLRSSGYGFWRRWRGSARPITFRCGLRLKGELDDGACAGRWTGS